MLAQWPLRRSRLRPWRVAGARGAVAALELSARSAAESGVREGDVLTLEEVESGGSAGPVDA